MNIGNSNPSRMLSNEDLCDRANELCDGTGLVPLFYVRKGDIKILSADDLTRSVAHNVLKNEAKKLRNEAMTHEGYVAGKGLVAQQFEVLAARVRLA